MVSQNSSSLISTIYKSRKVILELMKLQGYDIDEYVNFSINEVNAMFNNKQSDMLLKKTTNNPTTDKPDKIYIRYYLGKTLRPQNIQEMIDDLFNLEEILDKQDSFYVYIHDIKNPKDKSRGKGTGLVNYKLLVRKSNYKYYDTPDKSPEPECTPPSNRLHRLYVKIIDEPIPILSRKWNTFKDFDKEVPLFQLKVLYPFIGPDVYFLYVIDENI